MKVAFQGVRGAYSEEAATRFLGKNVLPLGFELSEQVCDAVIDGQADLGILPIENSIAGNVSVNLDLFYHRPLFSLHETYLPIHHCLLGVEGATLETVSYVRSHPVALAQCRHFTTQHNYRTRAFYDTAGSAKSIAEEKDPTIASIASRWCSEIYGLQILSDRVQHVPDNITRFLIFVNEDKKPKEFEKGENNKISLAFRAAHRPGSLMDCLTLFSLAKINLTRLESRPIPENPFVYTFFVDFKGNLQDQTIQQVLDQLRHHTQELKILGSYTEGRPLN